MNWNKDIAEAPSAQHVVGIANSFMIEMTHKGLAGVPEDCVPVHIESPGDIDHWHFRLASEYCRPDTPSAHVLSFQDLVVFFMNASRRLAELAKQGAHGDLGGSEEQGPSRI